MLINVTQLIELYRNLMDDYRHQLSLGKKPSQIKIRLDCILKALDRLTGVFVEGKSSDVIVDVDISNVK